MKFTSKKVFPYILIFIFLNSFSFLFYYIKDNSFVINKSYSIDYELLSLVHELDKITSAVSSNVYSTKRIIGIDEIEQLYFKMINTQSTFNFDKDPVNIKILVSDSSFKLRDYENRIINVEFSTKSKSKEDLLYYIDSFDSKVSKIFRENVYQKLLAKQIFLSVQENFEKTKEIYNEKIEIMSFLFDPEKLKEKIDNIKLVNSSTVSIDETKNINHLIFYLMLSSVISLLISIIIFAFQNKIEW